MSTTTLLILAAVGLVGAYVVTRPAAPSTTSSRIGSNGTGIAGDPSGGSNAYNTAGRLLGGLFDGIGSIGGASGGSGNQTGGGGGGGIGGGSGGSQY